MEYTAVNDKMHLSYQTSVSSKSTYKSKTDDLDDKIETDMDEHTGSEMEDEEDEEFHPSEQDFSSDCASSAGQRSNVGQISQNLQTAKKSRHWRNEEEDFNTENLSNSVALHRELRNLNFLNPGNRCTLPVSSRAKRTVISSQQAESSSGPPADRRITRKRMAKKNGSYSDGKNKLTLRYNNKGRLLISGQPEIDLCDCLDQKCNGCQYQCKKCGTNKCSYACRISRTTFIEHIDMLGGGRVINQFL